MASLLPHIKSGRLKALPAIPTHRLPELPNVPTLAGPGFPGIGTNAWQGMAGPPRPPTRVVDRLSGSVAAALSKREEKEDLAVKLLAVTVSPSPQAYNALVRKE